MENYGYNTYRKMRIVGVLREIIKSNDLFQSTQMLRF